MKNLLKKIFGGPYLAFKNLGFKPKKIKSLKYYNRYRREKNLWIKQGGKITRENIVLFDYDSLAGSNKGHYFHQDLLVAKLIYENQPNRHLDIGSRIDGFISHVASFREVEVVDVRPLGKSEHENIKFIQADLMKPLELGKTDSLSCLHAIEHFGLGRFGDPIMVDGHIKGIENLVDLVKKDGRLYISFPIGQNDEVHFNAHRVFNPSSVFNYSSIKKNMNLERFDYVDDLGNLHKDIKIEDINPDTKYGCGIYTFLRKTDN